MVYRRWGCTACDISACWQQMGLFVVRGYAWLTRLFLLPAGIRPVVHWSESPEDPKKMLKAHSGAGGGESRRHVRMPAFPF